MKNTLKISIILAIFAVLAPFSVSYANSDSWCGSTSYTYTVGGILFYAQKACSPPLQPEPTPTPTPTQISQYAVYPTVNLYANINSVSPGQSATLFWNTSNASSCYASSGWSGSKNISGSETVYPYTAITYTLTCTSYSGQQSSDSETIYVNQYYPTPTPVQQGLGAACSISPDSPRIGNIVTFIAFESGGTAPYYYSWSGEVSGASKSVSRTFSTTGQKTASVKITDAYGRTSNGVCDVNVLAAAPAPTPSPTPTVGQVQGASTVC